MEEHFIYVQGQTEPIAIHGSLVDEVRRSLTTPGDDGAIVLTQSDRQLILPLRSIVAMESRARTGP
ncbi:MAG TPA: hypothetical protein VME66_08065 [Candidatus Acidoferrales bacterium]|nr:hypothetical protein [Candidatus Acidoferrales bacterium]